MGIEFRDFVPRAIADRSGLWTRGATEFETFEDAVEAAQRWLADSGVELVQIETVVLPNIWSPQEEGSTDAALRIKGKVSTTWHQFVRCWYRTPTKLD